MVKIVRDNHELKVTKGAYENIFKPLGYTLAEVKKIEVKKSEVKPIEVKEPEKAVKTDDFKGKKKKQED